MYKNFLFLSLLLCFKTLLTLNVQVKESKQLDADTHYVIYSSSEFPLVAHVITIPTGKIDIKLIPAAGQREEVRSIAQRNSAFIAINGSNYRRGGRYNGNRLNLLYLDKQIYCDLQFLRGSFGWKSTSKTATIDTTYLKIDFLINKQPLPVDHINQPRTPGKSTIYTHNADKFLALYTPGKNIIINNTGVIHDITVELPNSMPPDWYLYQVDKDALGTIEKGMSVEFNYEIKSVGNSYTHHEYDFILGGAGLLIQNGEVISDRLYNEFSQGSAVVHGNDEVAADFHTKEMQEWLIEQRHPRTAIGITDKNEICIVVIDGRQNDSQGLTLHELAAFMKTVGCINALNIGGGGCSTLCINNQLINKPSAHEERPVSEALCILKS